MYKRNVNALGFTMLYRKAIATSRVPMSPICLCSRLAVESSCVKK
jgi:hypothetical protein